jgi:hypothetical protein
VSGILDRNKISNVVAMDEAQVPIHPVQPRRVAMILAGLATGLLGGLALAYLGEFLRRSFANRAEAERGLQRPVVATILDARQADAAAVNQVEARHVASAVRRPIARKRYTPYCSRVPPAARAGRRLRRRWPKRW